MQTKHLTQVALMVAIIIILGLFPPIPLGFIPAPIVIQNLGILLAGLLFGARRGTLAVGLFLGLVALGFPFLPGGRAGLAMFVGPTCGYLLAYLLVPSIIAVMSRLLQAKAHWWRLMLVVLFTALVVIDGLGAVGLAIQSHIGLNKALVIGAVFVPGDAIKAVLAVIIARNLQRHGQIRELLK
ncbi:biotin transporter BioY [Agrilactobacillus yilanensis]|uniref:Biotin transporter n=1 Tax=Agrilactobacillus yilanensis TaxID=2485997 RepID=A0ABW4J537_9LACO|nr:biotin transporter BioY [Agrilactobacillus yilanensis]